MTSPLPLNETSPPGGVVYHTFPNQEESTPKASPTWSDSRSSFLPAALILTSSLFFSLMHCSVRYTTMTYSTSSFYVVSFRGLIQASFGAALIAAYRDPTMFTSLNRRGVLLVWLRGLMGTLSMLCRYTALTYIPIAIASSLLAMTPIFTVILGWLFLGERLTLTDRLVMLGATSGALIVGLSSPADATTEVQTAHLYGVLLALSGATCSSLVFVLLRAIGTKVHFLLTVVTVGINAMIWSFVAHAVVGWNLWGSFDYFATKIVHAKGGEWLGLLGVGGFAFMAALSFNRGAQLSPAGRTGLLRSADIPMNFATGFLLLGEMPTAPGQLLGCALIAASTGVLAYKSFLKNAGREGGNS